jgi:ribosomal protein S18 acetylase RimI-like enzyme
MHHEITEDEIRIRLATADDTLFIQSLAERFARAGTPPWRDTAQMWQFHQRSMREVSAATSNPDDLVLIAEDGRGLRLGFLYATRIPDFFTGEQQGYVSDVAVSEQAEGKGVARALMERAEAWARECGFRILALDVFALNTHARSFYQRLGYVEETLKLNKEL